MKRILLPILAITILVLALVINHRFHLYERFFKPGEYYFVTARGTDFFLEGEPFRFIGANTRLIHGEKERRMLSEAMQNINGNNMRVIRQWAIGECENDSIAKHLPIDKYYFQAGPNRWIEESFVHFDSLLVEAAKQDIKVMITLVNSWRDFGGMSMYVYWAGITDDSLNQVSHDTFYVDPKIEEWTKAFIQKFVTRRNSVSGILYKDDPTIFSWELVNEARARLDKYPAMLKWTDKMANFIKELDPYHMVGISLVMVDNRLEREHIKNVFRLNGIDYVDMHMYPAEHWWENFIIDKNKLQQLIDDFIQIAHYVVDKPLVIGEVGFKRNINWIGQSRSELFNTLFEYSYKHGVAGIMVWTYSDPAWKDVYEINWREDEDSEICSLLTAYGEKIDRNEIVSERNNNVGPEYGESLRIQINPQTFEIASILPVVNNHKELQYKISPQSYSEAKWINFNYWDREKKGYAYTYGKDQGYFEYPFFVPEQISIDAINIKARLSAAFPPIPGADTLGVSDVTVSINNQKIATFFVKPQRYFGTVHEINITRDHGRQLLKLAAGENRLTFEVNENALNKNGIEIFSTAITSKYKSTEIPICLNFKKFN